MSVIHLSGVEIFLAVCVLSFPVLLLAALLPSAERHANRYY